MDIVKHCFLWDLQGFFGKSQIYVHVLKCCNFAFRAKSCLSGQVSWGFRHGAVATDHLPRAALKLSRACSHQLVRHRMASFSQRSQRYCFEDGFNYIEPEDINENENEDKFFRDFMRHSKEVYSKLIDKGVKPEDARMVLPNACETKIIVTMNARELLHFFKLRCCKRAQKEIREVAFMMKNICRKVAPNVFQYAGPNCLKGYCTEGEKSCMKDNDNIKKIIP